MIPLRRTSPARWPAPGDLGGVGKVQRRRRGLHRRRRRQDGGHGRAVRHIQWRGLGFGRLSTAAVTVMYQPSGEQPLTHRTEFTVNAGTEFSKADNRNRSAQRRRRLRCRLDGISGDGVKAYAIAPVGSTDEANVRVTCESSAMAGCRVFFECRDQAGMSTFGESGAAVGPNMTQRWDQDQIQDALGVDELDRSPVLQRAVDSADLGSGPDPIRGRAGQQHVGQRLS